MTAPARPDPLKVECPKCLSEWHEPCHQVTRRGFIALYKLSLKPHVVRVRAAAGKDEAK